MMFWVSFKAHSHTAFKDVPRMFRHPHSFQGCSAIHTRLIATQLSMISAIHTVTGCSAIHTRQTATEEEVDPRTAFQQVSLSALPLDSA